MHLVCIMKIYPSKLVVWVGVDSSSNWSWLNQHSENTLVQFEESEEEKERPVYFRCGWNTGWMCHYSSISYIFVHFTSSRIIKMLPGRDFLYWERCVLCEDKCRFFFSCFYHNTGCPEFLWFVQFKMCLLLFFLITESSTAFQKLSLFCNIWCILIREWKFTEYTGFFLFCFFVFCSGLIRLFQIILTSIDTRFILFF